MSKTAVNTFVVDRTARSPAGGGLIGLLSGLAFVSAGLVAWRAEASGWVALYGLSAFCAIVGLLVPQTLKMANQWERAIVLRLGQLHSVRGPGLFLLIPFLDNVAAWLDQRIQTTEFDAEEALSKDTVPINIDAVVFWQIHDPERAALEITDYRSAIERVAQTSLREMVGASELNTLLSDRKLGDALLREEIGRKIADWGVSVISVEIRDIGVPPALQDAMSRQAQAQRERQARLLLGQAEQDRLAERLWSHILEGDEIAGSGAVPAASRPVDDGVNHVALGEHGKQRDDVAEAFVEPGLVG